MKNIIEKFDYLEYFTENEKNKKINEKKFDIYAIYFMNKNKL